jgi:hypothetical protein
MSLCNATIGISNRSSNNCLGANGCQSGVCANFTIKRHDTKPDFKVLVEDCDGPLDLTDPLLVLEANMWSKGKLKAAITAESTYFRLADDIGFEQIMQNDIIIMDRARLPEHMLVTGFDETNKLIRVQRAYHGTTASEWVKGTAFRVFRVLGVSAEIESVYEDIAQVDGTTLEDQLIETYLVYKWSANDTCLPGCYSFEFKLLKMEEPLTVGMLTSDEISFTPSTLDPSDFGCALGTGVEWVRRFPPNTEAFTISVVDSPTAEL